MEGLAELSLATPSPKEYPSHGYLQGDLSDCGQAQLRSLVSSRLE